jgi:hypothetical protein
MSLLPGTCWSICDGHSGLRLVDSLSLFITSMSGFVQEYYSAQGYHQVQEDYKVLMDNGSIREVVLQKENVPDMYLQRPISFRTRYVMQGGILSRVLLEYFDVSLSELMNSFKSNYRGNSINDYYFNADYSTYTRIYLGANKLATAETKPTQLSDFPPGLREIVRNSIEGTKKRNEQERENEQSAATKISQAERVFTRIDRKA